MAIDTRKSLVKKYNPNHGVDGRFTSGSSGLGNRRIGERGGGTAGAPVKDAFGRSMGYQSPHLPTKQTVAAHSPQAQQTAAHLHGASDGGSGIVKDRVFIPGVTDEFGRTAEEQAAAKVPKFQIENPAGPGFQFSSAQRQANAREMFGASPLKPDPYGETARKPNILVRPEPAAFATTMRTPKTPVMAETARTPATTRHAPKEATFHAPSKDINEYVNTQHMRRLEGESLSAYVERRNSLLKTQRDREAKVAKARANASAPFLRGRPPAFVR